MQAYLDTLRQGPQAFEGLSSQLDDLAKQTQNLHNRWQEVENRIKIALAPVALNVVDDISKKMDGFVSWLSAHQDDLRNFFEASINIIEEVVEGLAKIAAWLGQHPALIQAVTVAFATWEAMKGVGVVLTALEGIVTWLRAAPAAAATAGTSIAAAGVEAEAGWAPLAGTLGVIAATLAAIGASAGSAPGATASTASDKQIAGNRYFKEHNRMPDGYQQWLQGSGPMPKDIGPYFHPGEKPAQPGAAGAGAPGAPPAWIPGPGQAPMTWVPGQGYVPVPGAPGSAPGAAGGAPGDLLTPDDLTPGAKGPRLPTAPQVPYAAGYGAPPSPGETAEQYNAQQRVLEQQHAVAEAQARLNQLEAGNNATADDLTKARNDLLKAQKDEQDSELQLYQEQTRQLGQHAQQMGDLGAKIDQDFGISKGLPGIAENLTKFLANLTMAPVLGAMGFAKAGLDASMPTGYKPGSGLIGMGGAAGMFGAQFMPGYGAGGVPAGMPQGPFGGYPGAKGASGAATGAYGIPGVGGAGFAGIAMPAGDTATYTTAALAGLGLSPLAQNPAGGGNPEIPGWVQDFVHQYGGPDLTAGSSPHGSLHGNPGGPDYAVDVTGDPQEQDKLAEFLAANPSLSAMMIHQGVGGKDFGVAGGQNVPYGTYFTTPGGTYADESTMVHWAPSIRPDMAGGPAGGAAPSGLNWDALAQAEAGGNWANTSNPNYSGGLQFNQQTWNAYKPPGAPDNPAQATREQQIAAAQAGIRARGGPQSLWPQNWGKLGWSPNAPSFDQGGSVGSTLAGAGHAIAGGAQNLWHSFMTPNPNAGMWEDDNIDAANRAARGNPSLRQQWNQLWQGFAAGGTVEQQYGPGARPIVAHEGEHVLTRDDVQAIGGQQAVYNMRANLHGPGREDTGQTFTTPPGGLPATKIGGMGAPQGLGSGFTITGGGLIGVAESIPSTVVNMAIAAAEAGGASGALYGGAIEDLATFLYGGAIANSYDVGGAVGGGGGAGAGAGSGGSPSGAGGGGSPSGAVASAAINIGMQELNEAISKGGQAAGALVGGFQQTFGLQQFAQTPLAQNSWITRIVGGIAGAQPQLPNVAGQGQNKSPEGVPGIPSAAGATPNSLIGNAARAPFESTGQPPGNAQPSSYTGVHIEGGYHNYGPEDRAGKDLAARQYNALHTAMTGSR